jgi:hypothetical protein
MKIIILSFALILFSACGQNPVENNRAEINNYPLTTGNRWLYLKTSFDISYNPVVVPDTFRTMMVRRVIGPDTSINSLPLIMVDDSITLLDSSSVFEPYYERHWWKIENSKLLEFAYQQDEMGHISDPFIYSNPRVIFDFPLTIGKRWAVAYSDYDPPFCELIVDSILAIENLDYADQIFSCAKIKSMLTIAPELVHYEWYSNKGLILEKYDFGKQYRFDEVGHIIDSVYEYDETKLGEINLIE